MSNLTKTYKKIICKNSTTACIPNPRKLPSCFDILLLHPASLWNLQCDDSTRIHFGSLLLLPARLWREPQCDHSTIVFWCSSSLQLIVATHSSPAFRHRSSPVDRRCNMMTAPEYVMVVSFFSLQACGTYNMMTAPLHFGILLLCSWLLQPIAATFWHCSFPVDRNYNAVKELKYVLVVSFFAMQATNTSSPAIS